MRKIVVLVGGTRMELVNFPGRMFWGCAVEYVECYRLD